MRNILNIIYNKTCIVVVAFLIRWFVGRVAPRVDRSFVESRSHGSSDQNGENEDL